MAKGMNINGPFKVGGTTVVTEAGAITADIQATAGSIGTAEIAADAITGAKIEDDAVSLEHLDAGIAPSHIPVFAANYTTTGGAAAEAITLTGALVTDIPLVTLQDDGTNNVTIASVAVTADTLTVTFSGDPGNDTVISYVLLRAAA